MAHRHAACDTRPRANLAGQIDLSCLARAVVSPPPLRHRAGPPGNNGRGAIASEPPNPGNWPRGIFPAEVVPFCRPGSLGQIQSDPRPPPLTNSLQQITPGVHPGPIRLRRRPPTTGHPEGDPTDRAGGGGETRRETGHGTCDGSRRKPGVLGGRPGEAGSRVDGLAVQSDAMASDCGTTPQEIRSQNNQVGKSSGHSLGITADGETRHSPPGCQPESSGGAQPQPPDRRDACWRGLPRGTSIVAASAPGDNPKVFGLPESFTELPCPPLVRSVPPVSLPAPRNSL